MARQKSTNKEVQKGGVIIVRKTKQDIAGRKANTVLVVNEELIWLQKAAHQAVVSPWLNFLKEKNVFWIIIKKDAKTRNFSIAVLRVEKIC